MQTDYLKTSMHRTVNPLLVLVVLALTASGCTWSKKDDEIVTSEAKVDYRESKQLSPLEIPPDLTSDRSDAMTIPGYDNANVTYSEYSTTAAAPAEAKVGEGGTEAAVVQPGGMRMERAGTQRWLVVNQGKDQVWPRVRDFLLRSGLNIEREDMTAGIIETGWAENHASEVLQGVQKLFNKWLGTLYSTGTRDKYRVRVEPGRAAGTSEIFLTHRGMVEEITNAGNNDATLLTAWVPSAPDPELEAEMLTLLMIELGTTRTEATRIIAESGEVVERARLVSGEDGRQRLVIDERADIAWRRVGVTLDRTGFMVEGRDYAKGIYVVRYADPELYAEKPGFFSKMFKGDSDDLAANEYQIRLVGEGEQTTISVADTNGKPAPQKVAEQILKLLHEQLK